MEGRNSLLTGEPQGGLIALEVELPASSKLPDPRQRIWLAISDVEGEVEGFRACLPFHSLLLVSLQCCLCP